MENPPVPGILDPHFSHLLEIVCQQAGSQQVYLVGGATRDLLMGRSSHDLDFALAGDTIPLARRVTNALEGGFYVLDDLRGTARVVHHSPSGAQIFLDFSTLRGPTLEKDLAARDFTINAIALEIHHPDRLIDPLGGLADLRARILRACSPSAFTDDPLRILRGIRQSLAFQMQIDPPAWQAMKAAAPHLKWVSAERQRDELFNMLSGRRVASAIRLLDAVGALPILLPEVAALKGEIQGPPHIFNVWEHTLTMQNELERLYSALVEKYSEDKAASLFTGLAVLHLGRFREQFKLHFETRLNPNRSLAGLLALAALLHDSAKPGARTIDANGHMHFIGHDSQGARLAALRAQAMALSQAESQRLEAIVGGHMRIHLLAKSGPASRRAVYRFFRSAGPAGVELCLLTLADTLATYGPELPQAVWIAELETCRSLLEAWFERAPEMVSPPRLVSGDDLISLYKLQPGRRIGELLAAIQEGQAAGEISDRPQALEFASAWLASKHPQVE